MSVQAYIQQLGQDARSASRVIARATTREKNAALQAIYQSLQANQEKVLVVNSWRNSS